MPAALIQAIWTFLGMLAFGLQLIGVMGILAGIGIGLALLTDKVMEVAEKG